MPPLSPYRVPAPHPVERGRSIFARLRRSAMTAPYYSIIILAVLLSAPILVAPLAACKLTPAEAAEANAIAGPLCADLGPGLAAVPYVGPAGSLIALICQGVESEIVAAETVEPVDAGAPDAAASATPPASTVAADGGTIAPDAGPAMAAAARPRRHAHFKVDPHCVATPIPNDPLHQWACPELHAVILAAEARAIEKQAARRRGVQAR